MVKQGLIKLQLHCFESPHIKDSTCQVRVRASDVELTSTLSTHEDTEMTYYLLPNADKIVFEMIGKTEELGYFELPMKKIYEFPLKKHLVTINCITKDTVDKTIKSTLFGSLKVSIVFLEGWVGKFDFLVDRVQLVEEQLGTTERELYVDCTFGNTSSQTTLKKCQEDVWYEFKQLLPFTLESIPGKLEVTIKDRDMDNDQVMRKFVLDPQKERFFQENNKAQHRFETIQGKYKVVLYCETFFRLKEAL